MMDCLTGIVGVTNRDQICITGGLTSEEILALKVSTSGLYLDDLPGGVCLKELKYVDATRDLYQMSQDALRNATKQTEDDLKLTLSAKYKGDKKAYVGTIGRMSYAQTLNVTKPLQGMRIVAQTASDAVLTVSRIMVIVNAASTFKIQLYKAVKNNSMAEFVNEWEVTTTANNYTTLTLPNVLQLPLMENGRAMEYWFVYDKDLAGVSPKDTKLDCSSCEAASKSTLYEFVQLSGVELNTMNDLSNKTSDGYSHGLILDVELRCESERLICREFVEEDAVSLALSYAVWYKAGELLIEDVRKQPDINRYTMMDAEYLRNKRNHFQAEYQARIKFLTATIDVTSSNCYVCRETANQPFFAGIQS